MKEGGAYMLVTRYPGLHNSTEALTQYTKGTIILRLSG